MAFELLLQEAAGLSDDALMEVVRFVKFIKSEQLDRVAISEKSSSVDNGRKIRHAGKYRGQVRMSDDFDAPLDDFKEYM